MTAQFFIGRIAGSARLGIVNEKTSCPADDPKVLGYLLKHGIGLSSGIPIGDGQTDMIPVNG